MKNLIFLILFSILLLSCEKKKPLPPPKPVTKKIDIRVAFGYKDARPARFVGDRYERIYFLEQLLKPCTTPHHHACGFQRSPDDGDLLLKEIKHSLLSKTVIQVRVSGSSVGLDDDSNRKNPLQALWSKKSEYNFLEGVARAESSIYIGHSRDGGGPDFAPPELLKNNHVNYGLYQKKEPGVYKLKQAIAQADPKKHKVVLLSCLSSQHFTEKKLGITGNLTDLRTVKGLIYYSEALEQGLAEVSKMIEINLAATTAGATT